MSLFGELRRRNVFKVAAAYAIVGWLLIEVASVLLPTFQAPDWVMRAFSFLVIAGFPLAVILAWAFDLTPQGIQAASDAHVGGVPSQSGGNRLGYSIQGLILLAVGFLVLDQYVFRNNVVDPATRTSATSIDVDDSRIRRFEINLGPTEAIGNTGLAAQIALSPDGRYLAYVIEREDVPRLYVREINQLEARELRGTDGAHHPFFSPDSQWIGFFTRTTDAKVKKISVRGGLPQDLTDSSLASGASWGNSDTIYFGTEYQDLASSRIIAKVPAANGDADLVLHGEETMWPVWPEVLPGERSILFVQRPVGGSSNDGTVAALTLETGEIKPLVSGAYRPRYVPTGHLLFMRGGTLWAVAFDSESLETIGEQTPVLEGIHADALRGSAVFTYSNDGLLVYASGSSVESENVLDFYWVNRDGVEEQLAVRPGLHLSPRLSPDGEQLATIEGVGGHSDVWVHDFRSGSARNVTSSPAWYTRLTWMPNGGSVVVGGAAGLWAKEANVSGDLERLAEYSGWREPNDFSPNGDHLVFSYLENGVISDLYLMSMSDAREIRPLINTQFSERDAAISPGGGYIAYTSNETGMNEIYVRPFPNVDDDVWQVSSGGGVDPHWNPEGGELFYRRDEGTESQMMSARVDTEPEFYSYEANELFSGSFYALNRPAYDFDPEGQRFLMTKARAELETVIENASLIVVENWFEELRRLAPPSERAQ